jgi:hypothetical protein
MPATLTARPRTRQVKRQSRPRPSRRVRPEQLPDGRTLATLTIGSDVFRYFLASIPCPLGEAFHWEKADPVPEGTVDHYDCCLNQEGHTWECRGYLKHGHCKHIDALVALRERQLI